MKSTDTKIWERQPSETTKAFSAFQLYLHMPVKDPATPSNNRTLLNVSNKLGYAVHNGDKPSTAIEGWSSKHAWVERARAYDSYLANRAITVREESLEGFQKAVVENATTNIAALNHVIQDKVGKMLNADGVVDSLDIMRLATAIKTLDDLSRRLGKMPTTYKTEEVVETSDENRVFIIGAE